MPGPFPAPPISYHHPSYLSLSDAEGGGQLGPLGEREEVCPLEPALQVLELQRRVDGPWLSDLLPRRGDPRDQLAVLDVHVAGGQPVLA